MLEIILYELCINSYRNIIRHQDLASIVFDILYLFHLFRNNIIIKGNI